MSPDRIPSFNIVLEGTNEYMPTPGQVKSKIYKMILGVRLFMHGETISIDDFFTEQTYQYQAKHVTQWHQGEISPADLISYNDLWKAPPKVRLEEMVDFTKIHEDAKLLEQLEAMNALSSDFEDESDLFSVDAK